MYKPLHRPDIIAEKVVSVYRKYNSAADILDRGTERDRILFYLRCNIAMALHTCSTIRRDGNPAAEQLRKAVNKLTAEVDV